MSILKNRTRLKTFLKKEALFHKRRINSINIVFCDDDYLLNINNVFLKHDYYTDIITFDLSPSKAGPIEAEIYISLDRVKENARLHASAFYMELHRVVFHGLLHLVGYSDKTKSQKLLMRSMEDKLLHAYFRGLAGQQKK